MSTSTINTHATRVQAAYYSINHPEKTLKQVSRKFSLPEKEIEKSVKLKNKGKLLKRSKQHWNTIWDDSDVIFHADDNYLYKDYQSGTNKKSTLSHGLFDNDYDATNGGIHYKWSIEEIDNLLASLPYRALEIMRDSAPGSEDYQEAVKFMTSDLSKAICKKYGLDNEEIINQALKITKANH